MCIEDRIAEFVTVGAICEWEPVTARFSDPVGEARFDRACTRKSYVRRLSTSFQRTPTRGGCGPLNSDR